MRRARNAAAGWTGWVDWTAADSPRLSPLLSAGNGKTLRAERLMKAFVPGWMTMAGPSSAKAGMQGDGGSVDGTNCFYDEMIDELTDGDGSNKTE